jgi:4-hydroxy-tetrahydrodipicolinate synthase
MTRVKIGGVVAAVPTSFDVEGAIDIDVFVEHSSWCLASGCDFLNVLGTTGEANSLSVLQRSKLMTAAAAKLDGDRMMVGTGTPDLESTVALTKHAYGLGYAAALVLPPYYYKPVPEDGIFAWFVQLVQQTRETPIPIYLYNFPQLTGIEFSPALAEKLRHAFPERIFGAKDSSGKLEYARELAKISGFDVFPSNEATLADAARDNYAGCISATVNIEPKCSQLLWRNQGDALMLDVVRGLRQDVSAHPLIPAVKYLVAKRTGEPLWRRVLPPNSEITDNVRLDMLEAIRLQSIAA